MLLAFNTSILEGSCISGQPDFYSEFQASQGYIVRPCLKKQIIINNSVILHIVHLNLTILFKLSLDCFCYLIGPILLMFLLVEFTNETILSRTFWWGKLLVVCLFIFNCLQVFLRQCSLVGSSWPLTHCSAHAPHASQILVLQ